MHSTKRPDHQRMKIKPRILGAMLIAALASPLSPPQAAMAGEIARRAIRSAGEFLHEAVKPSNKKKQDAAAQSIEDHAEREAKVTRVRLCPRRPPVERL